nr:glycosyltransferase family 2 protein [Mycobacterium intracellulare]
MNGQVRISVGIPVYNGGASLEQALRSISSQSFRDYEVIISDNASTDNTAQICREMAAINPRIKYFRQEKILAPLPISSSFWIKQSVNIFIGLLQTIRGQTISWS